METEMETEGPQKITRHIEAAIFSHRKRVRGLIFDESELKQEYMGKKKDREAAEADLGHLLDQIESEPPLFDLSGQQASETHSSDEWETFPLDDLDGLSPNICKHLAAAPQPIETVGELSIWMRKNGDSWAQDITGIGDNARQQIEDALELFWANL